MSWGRRAKTNARGYRDQPRPDMHRFLPLDTTGFKILEIGCGEGVFAASIANASEVWGIEPYAPAAAVAAERLHKVFSTDFEAAKPALPEGYFDLVVCNDVIEHMPDADRFLHSVQDLMTAGSWLVASVPNARYYKNLYDFVIGRDWRYQDAGVMDRTHLRFFTMRSLRRTVENAGLRIEMFEGMNGGIRTAFRPRSLAQSAFAFALIGLTGGAARDIRHLQIALRARLQS